MTVFREGHNLVTEKERSKAHHCLMEWIQFQSNITLKTNEDCTLPEPIPNSQVEFHTEPNETQGGWGKVNQLFIHGSFSINFTFQDFEQLGIMEGKYFTMHIMTKQYGIKTLSAAFGSFPFIKQATDLEWIAFTNPVDNFIVLHVNTYSFKDESKKLGIQKGDSVFVETFKVLPKRRR